MKHIIIRNIGPITFADVELKRINIVIGPQSQGKSTLLKIASFCTWVEKRMELEQSDSYFVIDDNFITRLTTFHKLEGYIQTDSYISYESDYLMFLYQHMTRNFSFAWKAGRWNYRRTKISYIPSERNLVATIPNWFEVSLPQNNIRNFMIDWETARRASVKSIGILGLGISYHFELETKQDKIQVAPNTSLEFTNTSSGLQSLVPMFVFLNYLYNSIYEYETNRKISGDWENEELLMRIYKELFEKRNRPQGAVREYQNMFENKDVKMQLPFHRKIGNILLRFDNKVSAEECETIYNQYMRTDHCDVFLEEPENNLFPPTQAQVAQWLIENTFGSHANTLSITTHSPYMLGAFMEQDIDLGLFYSVKCKEDVVFHTATKEELQIIYDDGIDAFFNLENIGNLAE
jgi:hypothetical protein